MVLIIYDSSFRLFRLLLLKKILNTEFSFYFLNMDLASIVIHIRNEFNWIFPSLYDLFPNIPLLLCLLTKFPQFLYKILSFTQKCCPTISNHQNTLNPTSTPLILIAIHCNRTTGHETNNHHYPHPCDLIYHFPKSTTPEKTPWTSQAAANQDLQ